MKKKLFSLLLLVCLCLLPQIALADEADNSFPTNGITIDSTTAAFVYTAGEGTVTYTPATETKNATLTMNNATIVVSDTASNNDAAIWTKNIDIDILLQGTNSITNSDENGKAIYTSNGVLSITAKNNGSLTTSVDRYSIYNAFNTVNISGGTYNLGEIQANTLNINNGANITLSPVQNCTEFLYASTLTVNNATLALDIPDSITVSNLSLDTVNLQNGAKMSLTGTNISAKISKIITIDTTSQFTLYPGVTLKFNAPTATIIPSVNNSGKFYNNGTLDISDCDFTTTSPHDFINELKLSGCGNVICGTNIIYTNDGTKLTYRGSLDISSAPSTAISDSDCQWDPETKTLTLNNAYIDMLTLPNDDATILINGTAVINYIKYKDEYGTHKWTIKGQNPNKADKLYGNGVSGDGVIRPTIDFACGSLYIENLTVNVNSISAYGSTHPFHITDSDVTTYNGIYYYDNFGSNPNEYELKLTNSTLSILGDGVNSKLWAGIINMNNTSVITLKDAYISNYGNVPTGLNGLKPYLPRGYRVARYEIDDTNKPISIIVTATGQRATNLVIKAQPSGGSGGGGGSRSYTIAASADEGGKITPVGNVRISKGSNRTFTITANDGYNVADVLIDGESVGAVDTYTFEDVRTDHTIAVSFTATQVTPNGLNSRDHIAYVQGYADGTIKPNTNITRAETATLFYRLLTEKRLEEIKTSTHTFSDIPDGAWYNDAVATMANGGYINGYADGTFGGANYITRAEFVAILARFIEISDVDCNFSDITAAHWAYKYIAAATANEWLTGYDDGTFRPDSLITRAEAITIINRSLARGVNADGLLDNIKSFPDNTIGDWFYYDVLEATNSHDYSGSRPTEAWIKLN